MAHRTTRDGYRRLVDRLNRFPQGVTPAEVLNQILTLLFTEREASLVALLPIRPFTIAQAATAWGMSEAAAAPILDGLADKAILVDADMDGVMYYTLPPPMAGFFEFSLMRVGGPVDQKLLSQLYYQYMNVEEDFIKNLFCGGETQMGRVFVHEPVLSGDTALHVLDYERASEVIRRATHIAVGTCYCRHKMEHLDRACSAPREICMTFDYTGDSLIRHGYARRVDVTEGLDLLAEAYEHNLVQFGENVQRSVHFMCHCCKCCCEALVAAQRFGSLDPIHTSNYLPRVDEAACTGCGRCKQVCPVDAIEVASAAVVDEAVCLGCGVCVRNCPSGALSLQRRSSRVLTPINTTHRVVSMAIERGTFQNLLFDNQVLASHRALAAVLGVILRLPPVKQILASEQVKSRYLARLIERWQL